MCERPLIVLEIAHESGDGLHQDTARSICECNPRIPALRIGRTSEVRVFYARLHRMVHVFRRIGKKTSQNVVVHVAYLFSFPRSRVPHPLYSSFLLSSLASDHTTAWRLRLRVHQQ